MFLHRLLLAVCLVAYAPLSLCAHVFFEINLTWEIRAPDGQPRYVILSNGQLPGPQLTLDYGDDVEFVVHNNLPFDSTVHFHGIEQIDTPWSDGTPGVSQKPIPQGGSFTYRWTATQYGAYWYHGHAQGEIQDGLYGPIFITPPSSQPSPFALIANSSSASIAAMQKAEKKAQFAMLSDWDHLTSEEYRDAELASGLDLFCVDSLLVNGKGAVNCQPQALLNALTPPPLLHLLNGSTVSDRGCTPPTKAALDQGLNFTSNINLVPAGLNDGCTPTNGSIETFYVDAADGWFNLHIVSAMSIKTPVFSIDSHPMWIYAVDGIYIEPQLADTVFLYNGERFSAMIKLDQTPGDYTIRVANSAADQILSGYAKLSYQNHTSQGKYHSYNATATNSTVNATAYINYGGENTTASVVPLDETLLVPYPANKPAPTADATHILKLGRLGANYNWSLSGSDLYDTQANYQTPLLFHPNSTSNPDAYDPSLIIRTINGTWVDVVLQVVLNDAAPAQPAHPVHKHSNKAYLIGAGTGTFNYSTVAEAIKVIPGSFNLETPSLRDSFTTPSVLQGPAWIAFRYQVVNPGAFYLHCHIQTHLTGGMAMTIMDGVDVWPTIPEQYLTGNGGN